MAKVQCNDVSGEVIETFDNLMEAIRFHMANPMSYIVSFGDMTCVKDDRVNPVLFEELSVNDLIYLKSKKMKMGF